MAQQVNEKTAITNLQRYLRALSFDSLGGNTVPVDGIFDTATRNALSDFQRRMGLAPTGVADKLTWDTLYSEYLKKTAHERTRQGLFLFPDNPSDYSVSLGERWLLVNVIQLLLIELQATYDAFEEVVESGVYDEATEKAIKDFQRANLLPDTGRVDALTWNAIVREYSNLYSQ